MEKLSLCRAKFKIQEKKEKQTNPACLRFLKERQHVNQLIIISIHNYILGGKRGKSMIFCSFLRDG